MGFFHTLLLCNNDLLIKTFVTITVKNALREKLHLEILHFIPSRNYAIKNFQFTIFLV